MAITVRIPNYLAGFTGGKSAIVVEGSPPNTRAVLDDLWRLHPGLRDRIVDEQGEVRQHINIFVGNECIRFVDGLATAVPDGSEVMIVPAVSGG
jgi:sulfur-carrier protein